MQGHSSQVLYISMFLSQLTAFISVAGFLQNMAADTLTFQGSPNLNKMHHHCHQIISCVIQPCLDPIGLGLDITWTGMTRHDYCVQVRSGQQDTIYIPASIHPRVHERHTTHADSTCRHAKYTHVPPAAFWRNGMEAHPGHYTAVVRLQGSEKGTKMQ